MLDAFDDFPIHQTPEPIAHPATSDRNFYDRTWFNGFAPDGSYYFGIGMAVYPHREILDCAFSVVERGGRQHCFYGSRRAPRQRSELQVGPFRIEIIEPMRRARVVLDDNETGISCELSFSARCAPIEEGRQILRSGQTRAMDATRFAQFGRWSGRVEHPDGGIAVDDSVCRATKDRSWGVRGVGEPQTGGATKPPRSAFFLWAPLAWDDHITHAVFFDDPKGRPLHREGLQAPLESSEAAVVDAQAATTQAARVSHEVSYEPGTRFARSARLDYEWHDGSTRSITVEPLLRFHMKGLGYLHPSWGQGYWKGELAIGGESFDSAQLDALSLENVHVQQVVRAHDGNREGCGVLEQICLGPYIPAGFADFLDGAPG